ncbi:LuxR C-terminal-related transcriptional regulator [Amorphoplanes digitatis]|uniref:DNA-binding CsgD family transcriptional regulator n=1 Tax=Actinoplanes digitatis TaxID=1868 RepID=A0A7W7I4D2_9ACTN|nr:LuxR C-terminal-related transcriptional regulator [Actinoplanes digitatis]MBB4766227.1 DNA-binding CsgD family transcriptional regulator [Actinoplanes digitatis]GID96000.1 transcriptional regulator [Actinoplanes digitatis]
MEHWEFVGRADELARLTSAVTIDSDRGLILSGAAGIGKSRLLQQAVSMLPAEQYSVHRASANIASSGLPFGGLAQILPPDVPAGLSSAGMLRWAVDGLHAAAGDRPIVLAIDDAHLLDPPSAALTHLLVREGATLLGALRIAEPVPTPISALWTEGLLSHAELAPLTDEESRELLIALVGGPVEGGSAQRLARLGGGNPLLLRELVLAAVGGGELIRTYGFWRWTGRLTLAPSLADLVDARLGGLTAGVRDVLELVSFGEPLGLALLLRGAEPRDVEAAEERGLIRVVAEERRRDVRLAHPLYGEVVRRRCPVTRSRRLLAGLADLVEGTGARRRDDLLRVAVWRLDSGTAQDATLLLDAARQAFDRFDIGLALRLAEAAYDAGGGFPAAELLAAVLLFADQPEEALTVLDGTPDDNARALTSRAAVEFLGLGRTDAVDTLAGAKPDEPAEAARVRALEAFLRLQLDELAAARALARGVLDEPAAGTATRALARCVLAFLAAAGGDPGGSAELIAAVVADTAAWRRETPAVQYALQMAEGTMVSVSMDLTAIDRILAAEFARLAQAGGFGFGSGWVSLLQARAALLRGRTDEALWATEQACAALAPARVYDGGAHFARANVAALLGQVTLAVDALAVAESAAGGAVGLFYPWWEQARAWTLACRGELAPAVQVLRGSAARARADGFHGHELLALYDLVRLGRPDLAADRMAALGGTVGGAAAPLLIRHARACADEAPEDLFAVAREFAVLGYQLFAAEAAAGAVRIFRQARDPRALAASTLMADVLGRCGTMRTPALLAIQPALTVRERQVAELAAEGVRSREIADRLYLSPRTVENHLQRVYTKLGVNGRVELAPALRLFPQ